MSSITANGFNSWDDFGAILSAKDIGPAKIRRITHDLPFYDGVIDETRIDGEQHYEARNISYTLELLENSKEALEAKKEPFFDWLYSIYNTSISDEDIQGYHFEGSIDTLTVDEVGNRIKVEAGFVVKPMMIADTGTRATLKEFVPSSAKAVYFARTSSGIKYFGEATQLLSYSNVKYDGDALTAVVTINYTNANNGMIELPRMGGVVIGSSNEPYYVTDDNYYFIAGGGGMSTTLTLSKNIGSAAFDIVKLRYAPALPALRKVDAYNRLRIVTDAAPIIYVNGVQRPKKSIDLSGKLDVLRIDYAEGETCALEYNTYWERF